MATKRTVSEALTMAAERRIQLDEYLNDPAWPTPAGDRKDERGILNPDDFIAWMEREHHYFGSTAFDWAVGATREAVIAKLARAAGSDAIKRNVKASGGLYVWTCVVHLPQSAHYDIESYAPVAPRSESQAALITTIKGATVPVPAKEKRA